MVLNRGNYRDDEGDSFYISKKNVVFLPKSSLKNDFLSFLSATEKVYCPHIGRPIFLSKVQESILMRSDAKNRLECFFVGIDIMKRSSIWTEQYVSGKKCIEIKGISKNKYTVTVHVREEIESGDKKLYLISVFYKK